MIDRVWAVYSKYPKPVNKLKEKSALILNKFLVSKEAVVLRRWKNET